MDVRHGNLEPTSALRRRPTFVLALSLLLFACAGWVAPPRTIASSALISYTTTLDVPYRSVDGLIEYMDIYSPVGTGPFPVVMVVHGGGWRFGDRTTFQGIATRLAGKGFVAATVDYRLAPPTGSWHAIAPVEDLKAAMLWLRQSISAYGGDPSRVAAFGGSAGGNLALMLDATGTPGADRPDAVVSLSGPTNLPALIESDAATYDKAQNYVGCANDVCPNSWLRASPIYQLVAGAAPTYIANSTQEQIPLDQATTMASALTAAGVFVRLEIIDGDYHSRSMLPFIWDHVIRFLRHHL